MLRKWLLSSTMVTGSRCCQEMLIEGHILDNSIHHCFHNCLHPPSWTHSLVKRRDVLQLLFLAKAASHKLYCNYHSADDFYHLGHMWSLPSTFKLSVESSNPCTFIAHSFTSSSRRSSFSSSSSSFSSSSPTSWPSTTSKSWQVLGGHYTWCFLSPSTRVSQVISRQRAALRDWAWGNFSVHWELLQLSLLLHPETHVVLNCLMALRHDEN